MTEKLKDRLDAYSKGDFYPYHMPGHKRRDFFGFHGNIAALDITEIDGFDNLHEASGVLRAIEERISDIYGASESHMLVNGSTAGVLAAISACLARGDKDNVLILGRNSHKSAYHALYLMDAQAEYIYGDENLMILPDEVEAALSRCKADNRKIKAVFITSPTYEGVVLDVRKIADICHSYDTPLIVDAAHGAHLGFSKYFAENPVRLGADIVVMSLHKTLPSLTQTAVIHIGGGFADRDMLRRFLRIYQTSSPSYILMASIDECADFLKNEIKKTHNSFDIFAELYLEFVQKCAKLTHIYAGAFAFDGDRLKSDIGKCIIKDKSGRLSGMDIYDILRDEFHIQLELAGMKYCLAMFTVIDGSDAYERLFAALSAIDERYDEYVMATAAPKNTKNEADAKKIRVKVIKEKADIRFSGIKSAWDAECESVDIDEASGRLSSGFVSLYPPGTPIVIPGEGFTKENIAHIRMAAEEGLNVQGIEII